MLYDVYCLQEHGYVVCAVPLEQAEAGAKVRSEKNPELDYLVVNPKDTPVSHYRNGKRTELVPEAASA